MVKSPKRKLTSEIFSYDDFQKLYRRSCLGSGQAEEVKIFFYNIGRIIWRETKKINKYPMIVFLVIVLWVVVV